MKAFGACVDWRRSFITTDVNPYYDAFVRWHLTTLKNRGKVLFGKRYTIWSVKDGQACLDHERAKGEGVTSQEYTLIKLRVLELPAVLSKHVPEDKKEKVFLVAATLRPETMYGQTNCWVLPTGEYGVYLMKNGEVFVCGEWGAKNMAYQEMFEQQGSPNLLCKVSGQQLIGVPVHAPLSKYPRVYSLPMLTISMNKGTGVVTSVPSDSPDDFAALRDLKNKPTMREKYGIKEEMVLPFDPLPIINVPEFGDLSAPTIVDQLKIVSQNDKDKLAEAKEKVYKAGFYAGTLLVGEHKDKSVLLAKPLIRQQLIQKGEAVAYAEPEGYVESRSGDVCIVALADQWHKFNFILFTISK